MTEKVLFITDPFDDLNIKKDTSILMMEESFKNSYKVFQCETSDLFIENAKVYASSKNIIQNKSKFVAENDKFDLNITDFKICFMRKDPPVDENYINALHLLGLAESLGANIYNKPNALKKFNEKVFAVHFFKYIPKTIITSNIQKIEKFFQKQKSMVIKPLDGMGGNSIYKIDELNNKNINLIKLMTKSGLTKIICQEFIEDVYSGDVRILIINGEPFRKTLARIPQKGNFKGNLAAGGRGIAKDITDFQEKLGKEIGTFLMTNGISFAGIDVIGEYLTEINITSPTCAREIYDQTNLNPISELFKDL